MQTVNYSPEQTALVLQLYAEGVSLEEIATKLSKSKHSIVAKLCREGVYKVEPQAVKRMKKSEMVAAITTALNLPDNSLETIEKASHEALKLLYDAVV